jgi:hypothetical protein
MDRKRFPTRDPVSELIGVEWNGSHAASAAAAAADDRNRRRFT